MRVVTKYEGQTVKENDKLDGLYPPDGQASLCVALLWTPVGFAKASRQLFPGLLPNLPTIPKSSRTRAF